MLHAARRVWRTALPADLQMPKSSAGLEFLGKTILMKDWEQAPFFDSVKRVRPLGVGPRDNSRYFDSDVCEP